MDSQNIFQQNNNQNSSSEPFGTVPNSEPFRIPNSSEELERVEKYSLSVRDAARLFEQSGVPRTERSILKWCTPNQHGVPRLAGRYEPNERRWLITEESVRIAIAEEVAKQREAEHRIAQTTKHASNHDEPERARDEDQREGTGGRSSERIQPTSDEVVPVEKDKIIRELEYKLRDEQITNRAKDLVIDQMEKERVRLLDQVTHWSRQVGVLETRLLQIEAPAQRQLDIPNDTEQHEENQSQEGERMWV